MKNYLVLNFFLFIVMAFSAGCATSSGEPIVPSLPILTPHPTIFLPAIPSLFPTIQSSCSEDILLRPENMLFPGAAVLSGYLDYSGAEMDAPSYLLQLESNEKIYLPQDQNTSVTRYAVSPDQSKIAYLQESYGDPQYKKMLTVVQGNKGEEIINIPLSKMDIRNIAWLNNEQLALVVLRDDRFDFPAKPWADVWLMDVTTLQTQKLPNEFPGQWNDGDKNWEMSPSASLYHPDPSIVLYPAVIESNVVSKRVIRVFNIQTQRVLAETETTDYGKFPAWSSDGQKLVFATNTDQERIQDEIFVFTLGGHVTEITNFSSRDVTSHVIGISWSPDNKRIVFLFSSSDDYSEIKLGLIDIDSQEMLTYSTAACLEGALFTAVPAGLFWSPDGHFVLYNMKTPKNPQANLVVMLDTLTGTKYLVTEGMMGVGWLR